MNTAPQPPQFKRRTIFIKKNLQIRYMMLIILSVLCGLAIMTFELTATLDELFDNYPVLMQPLYDQFLPLAAGFAYKIAIYLKRNNSFKISSLPFESDLSFAINPDCYNPLSIINMGISTIGYVNMQT